MTYEESAQLIQNPQFRGRIKVACLTYASRIISQGGGASNALLRWCNQTMQMPDQAAQNVQGPAVMEPGVQSQGANIDDGSLQFSVENAVNKML